MLIEHRAREVGHVTGHTAIRRLVVDPFECSAHIEVADLPSVPIRIGQDLEVAIIVTLEPHRDSAEPLALVLCAQHRLRPA